MISFELSLLILLIAVIILLILYVLYALEPPAKPSAEEKMSAEENIPAEKPTTTTSQKAKEKKHASTQPQTDPLKCPHGFGYLKKRDKKAAIPEECLACPRALECLGSSE